MSVVTRKKLVEVALPLDAVNAESLNRKQKAPKGWPTSFHKWWAQRPLAAARAVIFAQLVDDPSAVPELYPTIDEQDMARKRLFDLMGRLVLWDKTSDQGLLQDARSTIFESWRRTCQDNKDHPRATECFDPETLPAFHDPFSGSGSLPLSAQWLGLSALADDLNPVAVLINKALIEIPAHFVGSPPVNPAMRNSTQLIEQVWGGATGLAQDVRYYGNWMKEEANRRLRDLFPEIVVTAEMAAARRDLQPFVGKSLTVCVWLWARTVASPNPAFAGVAVPLVTTFVLSSKAGKEVYVEPVVDGSRYSFSIRVGKPTKSAMTGTKLARGSNFACILSGTPISADYVKSEARAGRLGARLMAIVADTEYGRIHIAPAPEHETAAALAKPTWRPEVEISGSTQYLGVKPYGISRFDQLFTDRQLLALGAMTDLVTEAMTHAASDALARGMLDDKTPLHEGGRGALAYAQAVGTYLACAVDRMAFYDSTLTSWLPKDNALRAMPRQALAMVWDFAEANPFGKSSGDFQTCVNSVCNYLDVATPNASAVASQRDAQSGLDQVGRLVVSTDPPYYDNVPYADLSDYFYVWLRRSLQPVFPNLFATVTVPKAEELVAFAHRHEQGKAGAEAFFLKGMTEAMQRLAVQAHPAIPVTIYYAFKQVESDDDAGVASTGWETFLTAVLNSGFAIHGTWPLRTEGAARMRASGSNALASSIVLVCRPRARDATTATRRQFVGALKTELPGALTHLQHTNTAPVDLAQAAIGPGMAVFSRYAKVLGADDRPLTVREALTLINRLC